MKTATLLYSLLAVVAVGLAAPSTSRAQCAHGDAMLVAKRITTPGVWLGTGFSLVDSQGHQARLMPAEVGVYRELGGWSPHGTGIVYEVSHRDIRGRSQLWVMDRQGGGIKRITRGIGTHAKPVWGPAGIAYIEDDACVAMVGGQGQNQRRVFCMPKRSLIYSVQWSPDGKSVLFYATTELNGSLEPPTTQNLYRVNVRTGLATLLYRRELDGRPESELYVSPNGQWAIEEGFGTFNLIDLSVDGGSVFAVPGGGDSPVWSADSKRVAFGGSVGGREGMYILDVASRRWRRVAASNEVDGFVPVAWSTDGKRLVANHMHLVGTGEDAQYFPNPVIFDLATGKRTRLPKGAAVEHGWFQP